MKKNLVIALLAVVSILSLFYGFYQKNEADRFHTMAQEMQMQAEQQQQIAKQAYMEAVQQRQFADANRVEAEHQRQIAEERLRKK
jgi:Tfp pilus assembly protein PilO